MVNLCLIAAKDAVLAGLNPKIIVMTSSTGVENPEIDNHFREEMEKMKHFAEKHGFSLETVVVTPLLSSSWQLKVLSGRGLPSYAGDHASCSVDLKVNPQKAYRKKLAKQIASMTDIEPVICVGTRFDESAKRSARMIERDENATVPVRNKDGELVLSPIAQWSEDDVWEYLGMVGNGMLDGYSTFQEVDRIYAHSAGTRCSVVAQAMTAGIKRGGCGARTGCFVCLQAEDKSLASMINFDPRYSYAIPLVKFNQFLRAIRYDWSRRHWLGRTVQAGYLALQPDTFHPATLRELFRLMLQMDFDESVRSSAAGTEPMFTLLTEQTIVAIDAYWSLNGYAKPFSAWADYRDIYSRSVRYDIPEIETFPPTPLPTARFLYVGSEYDDAEKALATGMRDFYHEALTEDSPCAPDLRELKDGRVVWDVDTSGSFDVDEESAAMLFGFEADRLAKKYDNTVHMPGNVTEAYKFYMQFGSLNITGMQLSEHDKILRRTAFKDSLGLSFDYDVNALMERSVSFDDLPADAAAAWAHKNGKVVEAKKTSKIIPINW